MRSKPQEILGACFSLLMVLLLPCVVGAGIVSADEGIRIDLPADGHLRVENQYGEISARVWKERYVSIAATIEGGRALARSPVVIENRNQLLLISIVRAPMDPPTAISLTVRIPETAHAEIITGKGPIVIEGLPASASLKSVSGNIQANLSPPLSADITARTTGGVIRSELAAPLAAGGHLLQTRIGSGDRVLRIISETGQVTLSLSGQDNDLTGAKQKTPELVGPDAAAKGAGVPASEADNQEVSEGDVIRVDSQLVTLNMSVIDRNTNRGVMGLNQSDFKLFEDGAEQQILQFDSASAPFDLMLLIDLSGSTRDVVKLIRAAAIHFIDAARPSDRIGIITFAGQPLLISALTLDRGLLRERVGTIDTAHGDTKLYDAADFAINELSKDPKNPRRKAIVLMSDGLDGTIPGVHGQDGSKLSYSDLLNRISEFDGVLYSLWLSTYYQALNPNDTQPEAFDMGHDRMKEVAESGGGIFYEVERLEDLAGAYEHVVADLGTVYSLSYRPTNKARDAKWRAIRVNIGRPSAVARGKRGYYAN